MNEFSREDRKAAQKRVSDTRAAYEAAVKKHAKRPGPASQQAKQEIAAAKDRYTMARALLRRTKRSGPGPDASRQGPPGPLDT